MTSFLAFAQLCQNVEAVSGLGAGSIETASAILTDIISIYRTKRIDTIF